MKHVRLFNTEESFINDKDFLLYPCVSYVEENDNISFSEESSYLICTYEITQDDLNGGEITLLEGEPMVTNYRINGVNGNLNYDNTNCLIITVTEPNTYVVEYKLDNSSTITDYFYNDYLKKLIALN